MNATESRKRKREEYEMQLFGFHSRAVYATLENIVQERIRSRSRKLCEALEKKYKLDSEDLKTLKMDEERLVQAYCASSRPHLKNIQNIVNRFIAVPDNVLLDEDKLQATQYTETEHESMTDELNNLQQRAKRATVLNAALKEELQLIEQFSSYANDIVEFGRLIENCTVCPNITDKLGQLVKDYKVFNALLDNETAVSEKALYNPTDDIKCVDFDINSL